MHHDNDNSKSDFALLIQCYLSGQISALQWRKHLEDNNFRAYVKQRFTSI